MRVPGDEIGERAGLPSSGPTTDPALPDVGAESDEAAQMAALEDLARGLHARGLAPVAVFVLEAMRPLSFVTAEFMVFLEPFIGAFLPAEKYRVVAEALHDRGKVSWLCDRLEELDEQGRSVPSDQQPPNPEGTICDQRTDDQRRA